MKLCMIGARGHSGYVTGTLPSLPDVRLTAICAGDGAEPVVLRQTTASFQPREYLDWREMLERESPDVLSVDGPFESHAEMCVEALQRNIHVFCEKPIALSLEDLERIEKAYDGGKAKLISMTALRYDACFFTAHKLATSGAIGEIMLIQTRKSYKLGKRPDFYKKRATYGGTISWVGSHAIDWILWFSGSEFAIVAATQTTRNNRDHGELEVACQCQFTMKNGVLAQASLDFLRPDAAPSHGDDRIRVVGTTGVLEVAEGEVTLIDRQGKRKLEQLCKPELAIFPSFIASIKGQGDCLTDARETFVLTRACLKAQQAADEHKIIAF